VLTKAAESLSRTPAIIQMFLWPTLVLAKRIRSEEGTCPIGLTEVELPQKRKMKKSIYDFAHNNGPS
jgi:hypothetical protein